jgi:ribosomal protein L29
MELHKLDVEDLKGMDPQALNETEVSIRRELMNLRMDIYSPAASHVGKKRSLKKNLARILTLKSLASKGAAPKAARVVAKTAAPKKTAKAKTKKPATKKG